MRDSWLELVDRLLRPARPRLAACRQAGELARAAARQFATERALALDVCQRRIEEARAAVFAADDGVIPARMTDLEREWRRLTRRDHDDGLMELWQRIAPPSWIDRKYWRDSEPEARVDAALALAADVDGVEAAEAAVDSFRRALAAWGVSSSSVVRWRASDDDGDCVSELLSAPRDAAREMLAQRSVHSLERAERLELAMREAIALRFPERPQFARGVARAACVDYLLRAAALDHRPNPATPLRALWNTGYTIAAIDPAGITLEIPPLVAVDPSRTP